MRNDVRVLGNQLLTGFVTVRTARDRPSQMDGSQRFGPELAQVGEVFFGPGLHCIMKFFERAGPDCRRCFRPKTIGFPFF
jgi:hypothetical protein